MAKLNKEDIKGFECKHAFFMPSLNGQDDLLVVKEIIHLKDDTHVSNVRLITNLYNVFGLSQLRGNNF